MGWMSWMPWVIVAALTPGLASAEIAPFYRGFGGTVGLSYEYGRLGDTGMNLPYRNMTNAAFEVLLGYRLGTTILVGVDYDFRVQDQQTSLADAGGTTLAGYGWTLGPAVQYRPSRRWGLQGTLDVFGRYDFRRRLSASPDDHLVSVTGLRVKAQYFLSRAWTLDVSVGEQAWSTIRVGGVDHAEDAGQFLIGAGVTYHFGFGDPPPPADEPAPPPPPPMVEPTPALPRVPAPRARTTPAR